MANRQLNEPTSIEQRIVTTEKAASKVRGVARHQRQRLAPMFSRKKTLSPRW